MGHSEQIDEKSSAYRTDIPRQLRMFVIQLDEDQIPGFFEYTILVLLHLLVGSSEGYQMIDRYMMNGEFLHVYMIVEKKKIVS